MSAHFSKIAASAFACALPFFPRTLSQSLFQICHKFAYTWEASESMFRVMAGEGCVSSCSDAYPLPFPFSFSLFPFRPSNLGLKKKEKRKKKKGKRKLCCKKKNGVGHGSSESNNCRQICVHLRGEREHVSSHAGRGLRFFVFRRIPSPLPFLFFVVSFSTE
jgi:hypothetical protein